MKKILIIIIIFFVSFFFFKKNIKNFYYKLDKIYLSKKFHSCINFNKSFLNNYKTIFIAGHTYGHPSDKNIGTYPKFLSYLEKNKIKNEIIVLAGDITKESSDENLNLVKEEMNNFFNKIFVSPGNHDVGLGENNLKRKEFIRNFGNTFNHFEVSNNLFIVLDSSENSGNISQKQLEFVAEFKNENKIYNNIIIVTHHVIWQNFVKNKINSAVPPNFFQNKNFKELEYLIDEISYKNKIFYIAGDASVTSKATKLFCEKSQNTHYILTGMGSKTHDNFLKILINENGKNIVIDPVFF